MSTVFVILRERLAVGYGLKKIFPDMLFETTATEESSDSVLLERKILPNEIAHFSCI